MYIQYKTTTSWTPSELMSDVTALLTGTTDFNTLSASCDKANCSMLASTISAGWTLYDNVGDGSYTRVISAPDYSGATTKYLKFRYVAGSPITFNQCSAWNNVTHTGTDVTNDSYMSTGVTTTTSLILYILVTSKYMVMIGYQGGNWLSYRIMSLELSRSAGFTNYLNPEYLKPNHLLMPSHSSQQEAQRTGTMTKYKLPENSSGTTEAPMSSAYEMSIGGFRMTPGASGSSTYGFTPKFAGRNTNGTSPGVSVMDLYAVGWWSGSYPSPRFIYSTIQDAVQMLSYSDPTLSQLDELTVGGTTYLVVLPGYAGGSSVLLPKG